MKRDSLGKVAYQTRQDDITNSAKIFKGYTAKPIADAVQERLKRLRQTEQVKQNEDSAKEATKLVKSNQSCSYTCIHLIDRKDHGHVSIVLAQTPKYC